MGCFPPMNSSWAKNTGMISWNNTALAHTAHYFWISEYLLRTYTQVAHFVHLLTFCLICSCIHTNSYSRFCLCVLDFCCFTVLKKMLSVLCISLKQLYILFHLLYSHSLLIVRMCGVITNLMELPWFMLCVSVADLDFKKTQKTKSSEFGLKYRCVAQYFSLFFL